MAKEPKREPFEQIYAKLEQHVERLEQGGMSLDDAIAVYEEGMALARACQERLDDAELRITKLRESFADVPRRNNGPILRDEGAPPEDYEYVAEDEHGADDESDFS